MSVRGAATTKAVILAGGMGTRMRRQDATPLAPAQSHAADAGAKPLLPVGRPFLDYVLSALADAGIGEVCIVVPAGDDSIRRRYEMDAPPARLRMHFVAQASPRGTADALLAAREFVGRDNTVVLNADNYYPVEVIRSLAALGAPGVPGFDREALVRLGHIEPDRVRAYALLRVDEHGILTDVVEKPDAATFAKMKNAPVSMNIWFMPPAIMDACQRVRPSARGELELPEAVRLAVRELGVRFTVLPVAAGVLDLSHRADIPAVTERLASVQVAL